ncbi:bacillithiol system protein YtxJ [Desulfosporosinus orientis DSM 765]|uniref:Bacillithiol system protein YtxJ n=1 Tax=Desulfosporosinus orientis (strain ATCC 19365 / DSM 765 / NCIMB 8382 / VKM B-1628 / Singapore I) TaxID=768706 RepID=G7WB87_DESOD|nr:bacillithiol system redox-active protein YtxJ [Desulfosporosinus orientis]AET67868.1 bacillithiol system protein YtxJ [Desulfosporosinus orientis DSM 765]
MIFREIAATEDLENVLAESSQGKVLIFKHSTTCPISARAWREVQKFMADTTAAIQVIMIKVIESRPVSNFVAESMKVQHQSPQALLLSNGQVVWHASHQGVNQADIEKALGPLG